MSIRREQAVMVQDAINRMMWVYSDIFCGVDLDDENISFVFGSVRYEYPLSSFSSYKDCLHKMHNKLIELSDLEDIRRFTP